MPQHLDGRRVAVLLGGLGLAGSVLAGCGGGGGGSEPPPPAPGGGGTPGAPSGRIVYRNSGVGGIWDMRSGAELQFDPGIEPFIDPGLSVSRAGLICAARQGEANRHFGLAFFGLDGRLPALYSVERAARALVFAWPSGAPLAEIDGLEAPVWAGPHDELLVCEPDSGRVRLFDAAFTDQGFVPGLAVSTLIGGWDASPDGRYLMVLARDLLNFKPHVMPFERGLKVTVESQRHAVQVGLADCAGRTGWTT